jgi:hypothetical protein
MIYADFAHFGGVMILPIDLVCCFQRWTLISLGIKGTSNFDLVIF